MVREWLDQISGEIIYLYDDDLYICMRKLKSLMTLLYGEFYCNVDFNETTNRGVIYPSIPGDYGKYESL